MDKLLDDSGHGRMDVSGLGGLQYQKLVFGKLVDTLFENRNVLTIENCDKGPVDYIVHEVSGGGMLAKNRKHYFECKNYGRSLELDSVAKIMVVAVAEQPDSVHVVSRTGLQPQIVSYASRLFDIGDCGSPIFRSIAFHHWQTDHLLNFQASILDEVASGSGEEPKLAPLWWMTECAAFSETEIASSSACPRIRCGPIPVISMTHFDTLAGVENLKTSERIICGGTSSICVCNVGLKRQP